MKKQEEILDNVNKYAAVLPVLTAESNALFFNKHLFDLPGIDCAGRFLRMKTYYITFRSVTFAQRGEKILDQNNYRCSLLRAPRWMEEQGCGYALRLWSQEIFPAVELLRGQNVPMRRVYIQRSDGQLEELTV